jgi:hypothetical protein
MDSSPRGVTPGYLIWSIYNKGRGAPRPYLIIGTSLLDIGSSTDIMFQETAHPVKRDLRRGPSVNDLSPLYTLYTLYPYTLFSYILFLQNNFLPVK